jgi:nitrogen fixation protein
MSIVSDTITAHLPGKRKTTPSGWTSFNAPCCQHNGNSADTRGRGGLISEGDTVSYHCFNCGYKASWQPGRPVSQKLRKLLQWLNCSDDDITRLTFDVMRLNEGVEVAERKIELPTFETVPLPPDAVKIADITEFNKFSIAVVEYMAQRGLNLDDTDYYWSPSLAYRDRLIIPFYYENRVVGWTARTVTLDKKPKYLTETQPGFVYGLDDQGYNKVFAIVCEGQVDAIHVEGCALGGSEINDAQAMLINKLNKDIVVVPDRDPAGKKLVEDAISRGWGVSLPEWPQDVNDISDAVDKYGRLYTLYSIASAAETSPLKIRLRAKKWFG